MTSLSALRESRLILRDVSVSALKDHADLPATAQLVVNRLGNEELNLLAPSYHEPSILVFHSSLVLSCLVPLPTILVAGQSASCTWSEILSCSLVQHHLLNLEPSPYPALLPNHSLFHTDRVVCICCVPVLHMPSHQRNLIPGMERRAPRGKFLIARSHQRSTKSREFRMTLAIVREKRLDRRAIRQLHRVFRVADTFLESPEEQHFHARGL